MAQRDPFALAEESLQVLASASDAAAQARVAQVATWLCEQLAAGQPAVRGAPVDPFRGRNPGAFSDDPVP